MKERLLIVASTFPRWKNDEIPLFVYELALGLLKDYEVYVLAPHYKKAKIKEDMNGITVYRFPYALPSMELLAYGGGGVNNVKKNKLVNLLLPFYCLSNLIFEGYLILKYRFKVINVHWLVPSGLITVFLKPFFRFKLVITSHGGDIFGFKNDKFWSKPLKQVFNFILSHTDVFVGVSSAIVSEAGKHNKKIVERSELISMGIDFKKFANDDKKEINLTTKDNLNLFFVGRFAEKKGINYIIDAVRLLTEQKINVTLNLAGDGSEKKALEEQVKNLNLQNMVNFLGFINNDQLANLMKTQDIFISPSIITKSGDREGLPTTYKEAMAARLPLIVTNTPGVNDLVENMATGIIVEQKDAQAIANAVHLLKNDKLLLNKLVNNAFDKAKEYDWDYIEANFTNIFKKLLTKK